MRVYRVSFVFEQLWQWVGCFYFEFRDIIIILFWTDPSSDIHGYVFGDGHVTNWPGGSPC
jgi:hypothetical protein